MKHLIIASVLVVIVSVAVSLGLDSIGLLPIAASAQAKPIDALFGLHVKVISFLFALIIVFMLYSIVVFRRQPGDNTDAKHIEGNTPLELAWTVVPLAFVLYVSYLGAQALAETLRTDPQAMQVKVVASQWNWRFEYPDTGLSSSTLYLPVDKQVDLRLTSVDVIHSFWVPEFRVKQDAIPGDKNVKELRITPTRLGEYKVRCAELCGTLHATMEAPVVVMEPAKFQSWVEAEQKALAADPVARGRKLTEVNGCTACHSLDGKTGIGPTWKGIYGRQEELNDGTRVTADNAYIAESIKNPSAKIVKGFQNVMPMLNLTDAQIADVIEYLKTVK